MQLSASPGWFVSDGDAVVGPVETSLLIRGLHAGRVDERCSVWQAPWPAWRRLDSVREIAALCRPPISSPEQRAEEWIAGASDEREVIAMALRAVASETRATVGLAHTTLGPLGDLCTRNVVGERALDLLGARVSAKDPAMVRARLGPVTIDGPERSHALLATEARLRETWVPIAGTALMPIFRGTRLTAVLELCKSNRPFRRSDRSFLRNVARLASRRLAQG